VTADSVSVEVLRAASKLEARCGSIASVVSAPSTAVAVTDRPGAQGAAARAMQSNDPFACAQVRPGAAASRDTAARRKKVVLMIVRGRANILCLLPVV
jgi:hypothetical protein